MPADTIIPDGEFELSVGFRIDIVQIKTGEPEPSRHERLQRVARLKDPEAATDDLGIDPSVLIGEAAVTWIAENRGAEIVTLWLPGALDFECAINLAVDLPAEAGRIVRIEEKDGHQRCPLERERVIVEPGIAGFRFLVFQDQRMGLFQDQRMGRLLHRGPQLLSQCLAR